MSQPHNCFANSKIIDSRFVDKPPKPYTRRRHECKTCGKRFSTVELPIEARGKNLVAILAEELQPIVRIPAHVMLERALKKVLGL